MSITKTLSRTDYIWYHQHLCRTSYKMKFSFRARCLEVSESYSKNAMKWMVWNIAQYKMLLEKTRIWHPFWNFQISLFAVFLLYTPNGVTWFQIKKLQNLCVKIISRCLSDWPILPIWILVIIFFLATRHLANEIFWISTVITSTKGFGNDFFLPKLLS